MITSMDGKKKILVIVAADLHQRIKRILYWMPKGRTLQSICADAIEKAVTEIEAAEGPFKAVPEK